MFEATRREFLLAAAAPALVPAQGPASDPSAAIGAGLILHWYIFGPAWTEAEAARQLRLMRDAHVEGVLIFPTYPVEPDNAARGVHNQQFLDADFLRTLGAVTAEARRLGMTVDIVAGTGWPFGGPRVSRADAAWRIRSGPALPSGARLVAEATGRVYYTEPTGMQVKRAAAGADGPVIDHFNRDALRRYLDDVGSKLLQSAPKGAIRSLFCDSLEVYNANWTTAMPQHFERRRGYSLLPHLEALFDGAHKDSADVRCDFWRTVSETAIDEFLAPFGEWTREQGVLSMVEAYGTPPVSLAGFRHVDVPVGEHYEWREFSTSRWASSGGRLAGRNVIMAEAWTWLGLPDRFSDSLEQLKRSSDLHFLCGINALYGVTYAYSPVELGAPGWPPYFGPVVNHTQPYWPWFSLLADYVKRACTVLQEGRPVADIAIYLPEEDCMAEAAPDRLLMNWAVRDRLSTDGAPPEFGLENAIRYRSQLIETILMSGFSFDGIDSFTLAGNPRTDGGRLRIGACEYSVVILPNLRGIDASSLETLAAFVRSGGTLIATQRLPETAYGMAARESGAPRVRALASELFGQPTRNDSLVVRKHGAGAAIFARDERGSLREALRRLPADLQMREPSPHIGFVHRASAGRDLYFIANTSGEDLQLDVEFRLRRKIAVRRNLLSGAETALERNRAATHWRLPLRAYESCAVVLRDSDPAPAAQRRSREVLTRSLDGPWTLELRGAAPVQRLEDLGSWTELPAGRFFSGVGVYRIEFSLEEVTERATYLLDLGRVQETASVKLNGSAVRVAWMRPYEMDVTRHVKRGENVLEIAVSNLLLNRVLGQGPIDYSALRAQYGNRFPAGDEWTVIRDPLPSGLFGPVQLLLHR